MTGPVISGLSSEVYKLRCNMNEEIKAVADRLIGLREIMDVSVEEAAGVCGISIEQYQKYESGFVDIPVGILQSIEKIQN